MSFTPNTQQSIPLRIASKSGYSEEYMIVNGDESGDPRYYQFTARSGDWYILRQGVAANTYTYTAGSTAAATNWTNRASLSYSTPDVAFS